MGDFVFRAITQRRRSLCARGRRSLRHAGAEESGGIEPLTVVPVLSRHRRAQLGMALSLRAAAGADRLRASNPRHPK